MAGTLWQRGLITANEDALVVTPRRRPPALRRPVLLCPSAGGSASLFRNGADASSGVRSRLARAIADHCGAVVIAGDWGGANTFGNATVVSRLLAGWTWAQAHPLVADGPAVCLGTSMGDMSALNFHREHPAKVAGIVSFFGLTDLTTLYQTNTGGFAAAVAAAWGVANGSPLPAGADPFLHPDQVSCAWRGWYAQDDPLVPPESQEVFADAVADGVAVNAGFVGHDDDVITVAWDDALDTVAEMVAAD